MPSFQAPGRPNRTTRIAHPVFASAQKGSQYPPFYKAPPIMKEYTRQEGLRNVPYSANAQTHTEVPAPYYHSELPKTPLPRNNRDIGLIPEPRT